MEKYIFFDFFLAWRLENKLIYVINDLKNLTNKLKLFSYKNYFYYYINIYVNIFACILYI